MARDNADPGHPDGLPLDNLLLNDTPRGCMALPTETLYHLVRFLSPQDLIYLRAVSKCFHAIVSDLSLWRSIYATARIPLPPGPFAWQSIHFLQRALVDTTRVARTWTTEPLAHIATRKHAGPRSIEVDRHRWVRGRWLITSKGMRQLRARDVETAAESVLWDDGLFSHWAAASLMTPQAHFIYVAVHLRKGRLEDPVKLLECVVDDDTGSLVVQETIDVPTWSLPREVFIPRIRVDSGNAPYAYISLCSANKPRHSLVFDPRNRQFYKFPRFRTRTELLLNYRGAWLPHLVEVYFTPTHLFVLSRSYLIHGNIGEVEVVQTFTLPDIGPDHHSDPGSIANTDSDGVANGARPIVHELRLTHEILTRDTRSVWLVPIYHTTDPHTQTTTLRFMHTFAPFHPTAGPDMRVRFVCTDYILLPPPPPATTENNQHPNLNVIVPSIEDLVPITIQSHEIFAVHGMWRGNLVHVSHDGLVRGICGVGWRTGGYTTPTGMAHKFTVDATGEQCEAVVGDPCPPWEGLDPSRHYEYTVDAMRGKIWHIKGDVLENDSKGQPIDRDVLAIVIDFA